MYLTHISDFLLWSLRLCKRTRKKEEKGQLTNCPSSIRNMPQQRLIDKVTHARVPRYTSCRVVITIYPFVPSKVERKSQLQILLEQTKKLEIGRSNCGSQRHNNASFPKKHHVATMSSLGRMDVRKKNIRQTKFAANHWMCVRITDD